MQAPQVTVAPAIERVVSDWDEFTGHFEAVNSVEVRPRVGGFLQRVGFTEGAIVHQGDVLFVIDQRPYEAEVSRAEAVLAQASTRNQLAGMEVERAQKLKSGGIDPRKDNMLKVTGDGRKAALDMRLVDPFAEPGDTKAQSRPAAGEKQGAATALAAALAGRCDMVNDSG